MSKKVKAKKSNKTKEGLFEGAQAGTISGPSNILTVYQLGNIDRGIFPTAKELALFKKIVEEIGAGKKNAIFVPEGLVKVTQFPL